MQHSPPDISDRDTASAINYKKNDHVQQQGWL